MHVSSIDPTTAIPSKTARTARGATHKPDEQHTGDNQSGRKRQNAKSSAYSTSFFKLLVIIVDSSLNCAHCDCNCSTVRCNSCLMTMLMMIMTMLYDDCWCFCCVQSQ